MKKSYFLVLVLNTAPIARFSFNTFSLTQNTVLKEEDCLYSVHMQGRRIVWILGGHLKVK